jgi:hypothetical protein
MYQIAGMRDNCVDLYKAAPGDNIVLAIAERLCG